MPCSSSQEPSQHEVESNRVAKLLVWVYDEHLRRELPAWVREAASSYYGNSGKVHELTALLCAVCLTLDEEIIYNGRDRAARKLADWWDSHREADALREAALLEKEQRAKLRAEAMGKLTEEERDAL